MLLAFLKQESLIYLIYLFSVIIFIVGLKKLSSPRSASRGNFYSMLAMFLAVITTLLYYEILNWELILVGILVGALIGSIIAKKVPMTSMPETVALFNGFGGIASALVALSDYYSKQSALNGDYINIIAIILSIVIGLVTFIGSLIAFGKLKGIISGQPMFVGISKVFNIVAFAALLYFASQTLIYGAEHTFFWIGIIIVSVVLGITLVIPIGGGDMPVVVSLLNSYSGIAVSMTGFVLSSYVLIIVGSLVGASGIILTNIMCKAMNRSLTNVLFGGFGTGTSTISGGGDKTIEGNIRTTTSDDLAALLDLAESVVIIPGYGMAVAQAQHIIKKLCDRLVKENKSVYFGIHPVAGRMPGHMNVLLAESGVEYDKLYDMDQINDQLPNTNLVIIVGANDVVNPAAKTNPDSPIYGMPIINADQAQTVVVLKRSIGNLGYAGIQNELFYKENTRLVLGDAKSTVEETLNVYEGLAG